MEIAGLLGIPERLHTKVKKRVEELRQMNNGEFNNLAHEHGFNFKGDNKEHKEQLIWEIIAAEFM